MFKRMVGTTLCCAALALFTAGSAFAADGSTKTKEKKVRAEAARVSLDDLSGSYSAIFGGETIEAQCTADCGDGTGWQCTGESVTCVDGAGCTASGGGKTVTGTC